MIERFQGDQGTRRLIEALRLQKIIGNNLELATELAPHVELKEVLPGTALIEQHASDNDAFLILGGKFDIVVNGRNVGERRTGDHVGEMAAVVPAQPRSATVIAVEPSLVARVPEPVFSDLGSRHPEIFRYIARELSVRLAQRNTLVPPLRPRIKVFIISSAEAVPIARLIQASFEHDPFLTKLWTDGVFKVTHYALQSLEDAIEDSDFAIAIAHADDLATVRGRDWPSPRDNVIFELGLFMGKLGRERAILMEPREEKVKLPSDLAGVTAIAYRYEPGDDAAAAIAPACHALRNHIIKLGVK